jgi:hypothetical protein
MIQLIQYQNRICVVEGFYGQAVLDTFFLSPLNCIDSLEIITHINYLKHSTCNLLSWTNVFFKLLSPMGISVCTLYTTSFLVPSFDF